MMNPVKELYKRRYIASLEETLAKLKSGAVQFVEFERSEECSFGFTKTAYKFETIEIVEGNS